MSKTMKTIISTPRSRDVIDEVKCDLCGRTNNNSEEDWSPDDHEINDVVVSHTTGHRYGTSGGDSTTVTFHVCPDCFDNKLMTWFKEQGAVETVNECDW